jgi:hypothetical protein
MGGEYCLSDTLYGDPDKLSNFESDPAGNTNDVLVQATFPLLSLTID